MKGLVLAGGSGSRLWPITKSTNKHLLPVYDKPLIYFPIATLMLSGIRDIAIITSPKYLDIYADLFDSSKSLGINISILSQEQPEGLPQGLILAEDFIDNDSVAMILGDNIFHGVGLGQSLAAKEFHTGAKIFCYEVANPDNFGIVKIENGKISKMVEKPTEFISNKAITGLYLFDNRAIGFAKELNKSSRGEFEIVDLLQKYNSLGALNYELLTRGTAWLDTGTYESLLDAANYIRVIEQRQSTRIACLEEISWRNRWITNDELEVIARQNPNKSISKYLFDLLDRQDI